MNKLSLKRIIAVDPGYERLGVAIMEKTVGGKIVVLHSECFKTSPKMNFSERVLLIGKFFENLIHIYKPEGLSIENLFLSNNQKTAMRVAETRGVLIYIAKKENLHIYEFTPLQIKSALTGNGKSDKVAVEKMIKIILPELRNSVGKIDDEYDAIACGLSYFALEKSL
jgi:crossover junction endodeoxyribonuclease RuvC